MPRKRSRTPDTIEQDFLDALDRLKAGRPQNSHLREKVRRGKTVKISISTVALESGRARGLIGMENCRYPKVRQLIFAEAGVPGTDPRNREDVIANLRSQVAELRVQLANAMAHAAYHLDQRGKAERQAADHKARYERLRRQVNAGNPSSTEKVVRLFREHE